MLSIAVLSHGDGGEKTRCVQVGDDKSHGPVPASIELGCVGGGQEKSSKFMRSSVNIADHYGYRRSEGAINSRA